MLKINAGNSSGNFCDGIARRDFIRIGSMGIGGLTMANLLEAEAQAGVGSSHKAVINLFLPGGPPHQDMFDLKMDAPREIRGEFKPISTNVPGLQICEEFPRMAKMMDKFTLIRSIVGATGGHDAEQCMTGRSNRNQPPGRPALVHGLGGRATAVHHAYLRRALIQRFTSEHANIGDASEILQPWLMSAQKR